MSRARASTDPAAPSPGDGVRVSVIVPAFCEEALIARLLRQFTPPLKDEFGVEVVVSDGGSTDDTVRIARSMADRTIANAGGHRQTIGEGRNRGADVARGSLLVFLNADVTLRDPASFLAEIRSAFDDDRVIAATCPVRVDPGEEGAFDRVFHTCFNFYCGLLNLVGIGMGRGEMQAVRTPAFREAGGYDESLAAAEDFDLFRRLRKKGEVRFLRRTMVYESPRRYRALGYGRVLASWFLNALSVLIRGRSRSREWTPIR